MEPRQYVARPVKIDDDELLAAASEVMLTEGPSGFTLAKTAARAGVSAATLVKRFGSKQQLFVRLSQHWVDSQDSALSAAAAPQDSPLARLRAVALHPYHDLDHPEHAAMQLAALAVDLQHDRMRDLLHRGWGHARRHLARHATDAIRGGELRDCAPPKQVARLVSTAMEGGCLAWSVHPEGSLVDRLSADLEALLAAWTVADPSEHKEKP